MRVPAQGRTVGNPLSNGGGMSISCAQRWAFFCFAYLEKDVGNIPSSVLFQLGQQLVQRGIRILVVQLVI